MMRGTTGPAELPGRLRRPGGRARRGGEAGYNLVVLVIAVTVLNILLAMALPLWSKAIQREKEEELIFRGLQYAEAIRVFQQRFGRLPVRLEELIEVEPRSIRRLWKDPMTKEGEWGIIVQGQGGPGVPPRPGQPPQPGQPPRPVQPPPSQGEGTGPSGTGRPQTVGPIAGVYSLSTEPSIKTFLGAQEHSQWQFTAQLLATAPPSNAPVEGTGFGVPRVGSGPPLALPPKAQWIGRPFPPGIAPQGLPIGGTGPGGKPGAPIPGNVPGGSRQRGAGDGRRQ